MNEVGHDAFKCDEVPLYGWQFLLQREVQRNAAATRLDFIVLADTAQERIDSIASLVR